MSAIRNIEIIDFYFFPGIKGPRVRAMAKVEMERTADYRGMRLSPSRITTMIGSRIQAMITRRR